MASDPGKAVVLLSGGLDSTTTLAIARNQGYTLYALTLQYGQQHDSEIEAARSQAQQIGVEQHVVVPIDLRMFGGSALTSGDLEIPKNRSLETMSEGVPVTYVPARNTIFLSLALAWAEVLEAESIFIGVNAIDYSGYPDCRPEFIEAFERLASVATKAGVEGRQRVRVRTPLLRLSKAQIVARGIELGVDYAGTRTCYDPSPGGEACGQCDACLLRLAGFRENGLDDPAPYLQGARQPA